MAIAGNMSEGRKRGGLKSRAVAFGFLGMVISSTSLEAATSNIVFNGSITANNRCQITVLNDGALGVRADLRQLSSKLAGGLAGRADIVANARYQITAVTPGIFAVAPNNGDSGVTRQVLWSAQRLQGGGANFTEQSGSTPAFVNNNSRTRVTVNFVATRPTAFPGGHYEALVVLRCE